MKPSHTCVCTNSHLMDTGSFNHLHSKKIKDTDVGSLTHKRVSSQRKLGCIYILQSLPLRKCSKSSSISKPSGLSYLLCVHVGGCVRTHAHALAYMWKADDNFRYHPRRHPHCFLREGLSLTRSIPIRLSLLASKPQGSIHLSPLP